MLFTTFHCCIVFFKCDFFFSPSLSEIKHSRQVCVMTSMLPQRSAVATLGYGSGMTAHSLLLQIINPNVFTLRLH